jgi:hypothetical protein
VTYHAKEWSQTYVEFLGIQMKRFKKGKQYVLQWRQIPDKILKWEPIFNEMLTGAKPTTFRKISCVIGRVLWRQNISLRPLIDYHDLLQILRTRTKQRLREKRSWDAEILLTEAEVKTMALHIADVRKNIPFNFTVNARTERRTFSCSDASGDGWGYIIYEDMNDLTNTSKGGTWHEAAKNCHIFVKEYRAAVRCIKDILARCPEDKTEYQHIVIGVDNTAAAQVLRNMYTSNSFIADEVKELNELLKDRDCILTVVNLKSADNAADSPSRGRRAEEDLLRKTAILISKEQLLDGLHGLRKNAYDPEHAPDAAAREARAEEYNEEDDNELDELVDDILAL